MEKCDSSKVDDDVLIRYKARFIEIIVTLLDGTKFKVVIE